MSLIDELTDEVQRVYAVRTGDDELARLTEFYDRMKSLGLVRKREYDLPLIDTIGRSLYSQLPNTKSGP